MDSSLVPSPVVLFLGVVLITQSFMASKWQFASPGSCLLPVLSVLRQCLALSAGEVLPPWLLVSEGRGGGGVAGFACGFFSFAFIGLEIGWTCRPCGVVPGLALGSAVVVPPASSVSEGVSPPGVSGPGFWTDASGVRWGARLLQPAVVMSAISPSGGIGSRLSRWGHPSQGQNVRGGFLHLLGKRALSTHLCNPSGWVPLWAKCVF